VSSVDDVLVNATGAALAALASRRWWRTTAPEPIASMMTLLAIGVLLDVTGDDYTVAFCAVFVVQALGLSQILRLRGRAARRERERQIASRVETLHVPA
ncbi:hypothetical protein ABT024_39745, partial [Streptomyces sp. NPDC002812]